MKVIDRMIAIGHSLEELGFRVLLPNLGEANDYAVLSLEDQAVHKNAMMIDHLKKIKESDAILVVNEKQKDIDGYIGANSFLEIGMAFAFGKKIFLWGPIPEQPNKVEIMGLLPVLVEGDIQKIN